MIYVIVCANGANFYQAYNYPLPSSTTYCRILQEFTYNWTPLYFCAYIMKFVAVVAMTSTT